MRLASSKRFQNLLVLLLVTTFGADVFSADLVGDWSLTLPSHEAEWLSVHEDSGNYTAELLWAVDSANAVTDLKVKDGTLSFTRKMKHPLSPKDELAVLYRIEAQAKGDALSCTMQPVNSGDAVQFTGKRMPPLPSRPDSTKVRCGEPITLFNGSDLTGWRVSNPAKKNITLRPIKP